MFESKQKVFKAPFKRHKLCDVLRSQKVCWGLWRYGGQDMVPTVSKPNCCDLRKPSNARFQCSMTHNSKQKVPGVLRRWSPSGSATGKSYTDHPRRRNVTTLMAGLENGHIHKNLTQKMVNPRNIAEERRRRRRIHRPLCDRHKTCGVLGSRSSQDTL